MESERRLLGIAKRVVKNIGQHRRADGDDERDYESKQQVQAFARKYGSIRGTGKISDTDGTVLETGIDASFFDAPLKIAVERFVRFGFAFQLLVLERTRVEPVVFRLGFGDIPPKQLLPRLATFPRDSSNCRCTSVRSLAALRYSWCAGP